MQLVSLHVSNNEQHDGHANHHLHWLLNLMILTEEVKIRRNLGPLYKGDSNEACERILKVWKDPS